MKWYPATKADLRRRAVVYRKASDFQEAFPQFRVPANNNGGGAPPPPANSNIISRRGANNLMSAAILEASRFHPAMRFLSAIDLLSNLQQNLYFKGDVEPVGGWVLHHKCDNGFPVNCWSRTEASSGSCYAMQAGGRDLSENVPSYARYLHLGYKRFVIGGYRWDSVSAWTRPNNGSTSFIEKSLSFPVYDDGFQKLVSLVPSVNRPGSFVGFPQPLPYKHRSFNSPWHQVGYDLPYELKPREILSREAVLTPDGVTVRDVPHVLKSPSPNIYERKVVLTAARSADNWLYKLKNKTAELYEASTEFVDFVNALNESLPPERRYNGSDRLKLMENVWKNKNYIDPALAVGNIMNDMQGDRFWYKLLFENRPKNPRISHGQSKLGRFFW